MLGPITYLDAALIAVCFISGLLAMYRGFAREMLSIVSWAIAAGAVLYFVVFHKPFAQDMAAQMGTQVAVAQIVVGAVLFPSCLSSCTSSPPACRTRSSTVASG